MEQIYVLGACNIGSIWHESHTEISRKRKPRPLLLRDEYADGNFTQESKKMIPITFKRIGAFTGRLAVLDWQPILLHILRLAGERDFTGAEEGGIWAAGWLPFSGCGLISHPPSLNNQNIHSIQGNPHMAQ